MLNVNNKPPTNSQKLSFGTNLNSLALLFHHDIGVSSASTLETRFMNGLSLAQRELFENGIKDTICIESGKIGPNTNIELKYYENKNPK